MRFPMGLEAARQIVHLLGRQDVAHDDVAAQVEQILSLRRSSAPCLVCHQLASNRSGVA